MAHTCSNCFAWTLSLWLPTYLHEKFGVPKKDMYVTALPYTLNLVMGPIVGRFIDRYMLRRITKLRTRQLSTAFALLGQSFGYLALCFANTPTQALTCIGFAVILKTFCAGGWEANHHDIAPEAAGTTFGISNTFATIPSIVIGPLLAYIMEIGGTWCMQFQLVATLGVIGTSVYVKLAETTVHIK